MNGRRRAGYLLGGLLAVLMAATLALILTIPRVDPDSIVYPGAQPAPGPSAALLGLYGTYTTPDPPGVVAAWYAAHGMPGDPMLAASGQLLSITGARGQTGRLPIPGLGRGLRVGRELHYMALPGLPGTLINLWCLPACPPGAGSVALDLGP